MGWGRAALRGLLLGVGGIVALAATSSAHAQTTTEAAIAEALFQEGKALLDGGDVPAACRKLEESVRLDRLPGSLLNLALCHEAEGRIASAWSELSEALALARRDGRQDRQQLAEEHLAALEPRLPKLKVEAPPNVPHGAALMLGGRKLGSAVFGTVLPLDPGAVVVRVEADGFAPFETTVRVDEGKTLELSVPALLPKPIVAATPAPVPAPAPTPPSAPSPRLPPDPTWTTVGWITLAAGSATAIAGFAVGGYALAEEQEADASCGPTTCPDAASQARSDHAQVAATVASVLVPVGLTFAVGGAVLGVSATFAPRAFATSAMRLEVAF